jgi:pyruvate,water dikinase
LERASVVRLAQGREPSVDELGGKASSLVRLSRAGLRVPEGAVLPASWFSPWWAELSETDAWARFQSAKATPWATHSEALRNAVARLPFSSEIRDNLRELGTLARSWGPAGLCAVRSSSPDEDLERASFAGGYATFLGVAPDGIEEAVRACFLSCLDERVLLYKAQHGLDVHRPRIGVLVQRQVESEVSGVAFSLDPVTNDYDQAVIDAGFGPGEGIVSGEISPDHFVVDRPARKIMERRLGTKRVSRWILPGGGVELRTETRDDQPALRDEQALEITDVLARFERIFGHPVDVEWAYAGGELFLLQARPITTYFSRPRCRRSPGAHAGSTSTEISPRSSRSTLLSPS